MKRWLRQAGIVLWVLSVSLWAGDKKKGLAYVKPAQTVDLPNPKLATARKNCENWALAAGLETLLKKQDVRLDQNFWVMHLNFAELCISEMPSADTLAQAIDREFVLDDGRHVRLELNFAPGAPSDMDALIARLQQQQLSLLLWRGHPYYLIGATYDEYIRANGSRIFAATELRLADTFAGQPGLAFQKGRDDPNEIDGVLSVSVTVL